MRKPLLPSDGTLSGIDVVHVPFNGSPPAVLSTVQGETKFLLSVMQPLQA